MSKSEKLITPVFCQVVWAYLVYTKKAPLPECFFVSIACALRLEVAPLGNEIVVLRLDGRDKLVGYVCISMAEHGSI